MCIRPYLLLALLLWRVVGQSQTETMTLAEREAAIAAEFEKIAQQPIDYLRGKAMERILGHFDAALAQSEAFEHAFASLRMGNLRSEDGKVRVLSWNLPMESGKQIYFGYVLYRDKNKYTATRLTDASDQIETPEAMKLGPDNWYGALYYELVSVQADKRTYYTLLGWDGQDFRLHQKVIEVMSIGANGVPSFGAQIFETPRGKPKRVILRYAAQATVTMRYQERQKRIVFDHLAPIQPHYAGVYEFYGPDMYHDAFVLKKGRWLLDTLVDVRNEEPDKPKQGLQYSDY